MKPSPLKVIFGLACVAIIVGVAYYAYTSTVTLPEEEPALSPEILGQKKQADDMDSSVNAIINDATSEAKIVDEEDADNDVVISDSAAINELGQSYDETGI